MMSKPQLIAFRLAVLAYLVVFALVSVSDPRADTVEKVVVAMMSWAQENPISAMVFLGDEGGGLITGMLKPLIMPIVLIGLLCLKQWARWAFIVINLIGLALMGKILGLELLFACYFDTPLIATESVLAVLIGTWSLALPDDALPATADS